jgi:uncharacterized protein (UPF0332 family)
VTVLDELRARGLLQESPIDRAALERLMQDARRHLRTAALALREEDRAGAYQIAYDAGRKAITAMLLSRGLRARGVGAHSTAIQAATSIFGDADGDGALGRFDRLRRTRNQAEYLGREFDDAEVTHDIEIATAVVALADRVLADTSA